MTFDDYKKQCAKRLAEVFAVPTRDAKEESRTAVIVDAEQHPPMRPSSWYASSECLEIWREGR